MGQGTEKIVNGKYSEGAVQVVNGVLTIIPVALEKKLKTSTQQSSSNDLKLNKENELYKNLYPNHTISLDKVPRELIQDSNGRYWLKSPNGNLITPSGKYDFVTMPNGKIIVSRGNISDESTHLGLSNGNDVKYAGSIRFADNQGGARGKIKEWDNSSGHYKPSSTNANQAGLPLDKLVPNVRKVK